MSLLQIGRTKLCSTILENETRSCVTRAGVWSSNQEVVWEGAAGARLCSAAMFEANRRGSDCPESISVADNWEVSYNGNSSSLQRYDEGAPNIFL